MFDFKKGIKELKGKFLGGQYEKFLIGNKKDFLLIIKDILQENGKVSEEANELLNHHVDSMRKFCAKNYVINKDKFIEGIIETNFVDCIDEITADIIEEDGHIYEIIVATDGHMSLTEDEKNFGKFLSKEKNDLFIKKQKFIIYLKNFFNKYL